MREAEVGHCQCSWVTGGALVAAGSMLGSVQPILEHGTCWGPAQGAFRSWPCWRGRWEDALHGADGGGGPGAVPKGCCDGECDPTTPSVQRGGGSWLSSLLLPCQEGLWRVAPVAPNAQLFRATSPCVTRATHRNCSETAPAQKFGAFMDLFVSFKRMH